MQYQVYNNKFDIVTQNSARKSYIKKRFGKNFCDLDFCITEAAQAVDIYDVVGFKVNSEEYFWNKNGRNTIFIESSELVESLYKAQYEFTQAQLKLIPTPFNCFSISFPKGTKINGIELPPCLATIMNGVEYDKLIYKKMADHLDCEIENPLAEDDLILSINYSENEACISTTIQLRENLDTIANQFVDTIHQTPLYDQSLSKIENITIQILAKIAITLSLYNNATHGEYLSKGAPDKSLPKVAKNRNYTHYNFYTLKNLFENINVSEKTVLKQLTDPNEYLHEYRHLEIGSRWIISNR